MLYLSIVVYGPSLALNQSKVPYYYLKKLMLLIHWYIIECHLPHSDGDERLYLGYHHLCSLHFLHLTGTVHPLHEVVFKLLWRIFLLKKGGFKAVVWTDTLQIFLGYGSIFTVLFKGITDVGGLDVVWQRSTASSRTEFFK